MGSREDSRRDSGKRELKMRRPRKRVCQFCVEKAQFLDYKDVVRLKKFMSERGKILPARITGACAKHQRMMTLAIKRARMIALLPYTV
ncbi:MAG: 30S ribosomal protein S18 [Candidatus Eremiobacteraeota bacterium]|jgi:small subunit ribosomal protein S18|nr:30S ribosomal protein S18 [Candidatus Eremiobacteraeota bacterium]MCL5055077.1 30S ribosomal protein S18 [Bacillota bacterium]